MLEVPGLEIGRGILALAGADKLETIGLHDALHLSAANGIVER